MRSSTTKPLAAEQPDPVAVAEMEFDGGIIRPLEAMHPEVRPPHPVLGGNAVLVRDAQHHDHAVAEEDELSAGTQESGRFGDPSIRIAPDRRAVLADDEIAARVAQRHLLAGAADERIRHVELALEQLRTRELVRCRVDADRTAAESRDPRRDVARAAAQLDNDGVVHIGEQLEIALRHTEHAPPRFLRPVAPPGIDVVRGHAVPRVLIALQVVEFGVMFAAVVQVTRVAARPRGRRWIPPVPSRAGSRGQAPIRRVSA